jgi:pyridoxine 5-phosphate synthase
MTKLSVNVNKVALLRNSRAIGIPSVVRAAETAIRAGADGITVHPRPDERHIRYADARELAPLVAAARTSGGAAVEGRVEGPVEFNIEGNPFEGRWLDLVRELRPTQATLVPDTPGQSTSDHGWDLAADGARVRPILAELRALGIRTSLFIDADSPAGADAARRAADIGADRVELYTEPFAAAHARSPGDGARIVAAFAATARAASAAGLAVNAGHDLNLANLPLFLRSVPGVAEVSIGHALISDALDLGLASAVRAYAAICRGA